MQDAHVYRELSAYWKRWEWMPERTNSSWLTFFVVYKSTNLSKYEKDTFSFAIAAMGGDGNGGTTNDAGDDCAWHEW